MYFVIQAKGMPRETVKAVLDKLEQQYHCQNTVSDPQNGMYAVCLPTLGGSGLEGVAIGIFRGFLNDKGASFKEFTDAEAQELGQKRKSYGPQTDAALAKLIESFLKSSSFFGSGSAKTN